MNRFVILFLCLLMVGCGGKGYTPSEMVAESDLIVLGELRIENGQEVLWAREVLKGQLGDDIGFRIGEQISPTIGPLKKMAGSQRQLLVFYQKRFGTQTWVMTASASGKNAIIVDALRKRAIQPPETTRGK